MAILCFDMRVKFYDGIPKSFPEIKGRLTLASQPTETGSLPSFPDWSKFTDRPGIPPIA